MAEHKIQIGRYIDRATIFTPFNPEDMHPDSPRPILWVPQEIDCSYPGVPKDDCIHAALRPVPPKETE